MELFCGWVKAIGHGEELGKPIHQKRFVLRAGFLLKSAWRAWGSLSRISCLFCSWVSSKEPGGGTKEAYMGIYLPGKPPGRGGVGGCKCWCPCRDAPLVLLGQLGWKTAGRGQWLLNLACRTRLRFAGSAPRGRRMLGRGSQGGG